MTTEISSKNMPGSSIYRRRWSHNHNKLINILVAALLFLLAFVFVLPGLPPERVAAPAGWLVSNYYPWHDYFPDANNRFVGGDLLLQQLPWRQWMQGELAAGRFPLWSSSALGGMSIFGSSHPGVLYPLHLLWVLMPVWVGLSLIMALKMWLVGLGMWFFLRAMKLHPIACVLSAIGLMFSAWMVDWLTWAHTSIYLLLPWMAWAVYSWCRNGNRIALMWLAILVALAVFGGHPETMFLVYFTTFLWALGLIVVSHPRMWVWQLSGLVTSAAIGLALGAIQLLPFFQALTLSHSAVLRPANASMASRPPLDAGMMLDWILPRSWGHFGEGVLGGTTGFTEGNGYAGLLALLGSALAIILVIRRRIEVRLVLTWVAIGLIAWLLTYDVTLGGIVRGLPGFNQNNNARWIGIVAFAFLVVSAFGWDWIARRSPSAAHVRVGRWPQGQLGGAGAALLVLGLLVVIVHAAALLPQSVLPDAGGSFHMVNDSYRFYWGVWAFGVALALLGAAMLWAASWQGRRWMPVVLSVILLFDLWRLLITVNATAPADEYYPQTSFIEQVKADVPPIERILVEGEVLPANVGLIYGIRDWRAQDPMLSQRAYDAATILSPSISKDPWADYNMFLLNVRLQIAPMLGMQYYIFPTPADANGHEADDPGRPPFTRLAYKDGLSLWRAEGVPGFAYLSDNVQVAADEKSAREWLANITWDQTRAFASVIEGAAPIVASVRRGNGSSLGDVDVLEYKPGLVRLRVNASRPALLVVSESWAPGWGGTLDGQDVNVLRANYLSQGVVVSQGTHVVELTYKPSAFTYGVVISLGGLLALVALAVWVWWKRLPLARSIPWRNPGT